MCKGFTLVELSIVLVIIGLLIGGVLIGQSLIESARLQKIIKEIESVDIAVAAFSTKFNCLPGDCKQQFFGSTSGRANYCAQGYEGNKSIEHFAYGTYLGIGYLDCERNLFARQLDLVGMAGLKTAIVGAGTITPSSSYGSTYFRTYLLSNVYKEKQMIVPYSWYAIGVKGNWFVYEDFIQSQSIYLPSYTTTTPRPFSQPQALAMDQKMDDGKPNTGDVQQVEPSYNASQCQPTFGNAGDCVGYTQYAAQTAGCSSGSLITSTYKTVENFSPPWAFQPGCSLAFKSRY